MVFYPFTFSRQLSLLLDSRQNTVEKVSRVHWSGAERKEMLLLVLTPVHCWGNLTLVGERGGLKACVVPTLEGHQQAVRGPLWCCLSGAWDQHRTLQTIPTALGQHMSNSSQGTGSFPAHRQPLLKSQSIEWSRGCRSWSACTQTPAALPRLNFSENSP